VSGRLNLVEAEVFLGGLLCRKCFLDGRSRLRGPLLRDAAARLMIWTKIGDEKFRRCGGKYRLDERVNLK
jgi:hypothetical protein